ncbi:FkbM family methyltransferase [Candidatus Methylocalor cossyra]|uniref:Methyltransf_21 domain-containing protein n=1 Tax=Candidatus Methylocalor cossyra TaxID=3108543 RepID=A0ABM9NIU2_9GAMM
MPDHHATCAVPIQETVDPRNLPITRVHVKYFEDLLRSQKPHEEDFLFFRNFCDEPTLFLDIGGNVGNSALSVLFVCPNWRVVSFEPNPSLSYFMERVSEVFAERQAHFTYYPVGLGAESGEVDLYIPKVDDWLVIGEASIIREHFQDAVVRTRLSSYSASGQWSLIKTTISIVTFDSFLAEHPILGAEKRIVVKIDVEGAEVAVLKGMEGFIQKHWPLFMIENSLPDVVGEWLGARGYRAYIFELSTNQLIPKRQGVALNSFYVPDDVTRDFVQAYRSDYHVGTAAIKGL